MKHIEKWAHLVLIGGFLVGSISFFRAPAGEGRFLVVFSMTLFYLVWGLLYHHIRRDLSYKILLEYLAIAAIASVVNILVFLRG